MASPLHSFHIVAFCGTSFSVEHALAKGGLPSIRHNKIRDLTATLLTNVCSQVAIATEPAMASFPRLAFLYISYVNVAIATAWYQIGHTWYMNHYFGERSECTFVDVGFF